MRSIISALITIWLAATIAFFTMRLLPSNALEAQLAQSGASPLVVQERMAQQGLSDSVAIQYLRFLGNLVQGDLGYSLLHGQPVAQMILDRLEPTLVLASSALIVAISSGLLLGILITFDIRWGISTLARLLTTLSLSMPVYWSGTLGIMMFSGVFNLLPSSGAGGFSHLILPAGILGIHIGSTIAQMIATNLTIIKRKDFVRTARAKGLPEPLIVRRHILRVGLLPTISIIMLQAGFLMSGTVIVESLFVRPGIGRLLFDSTLQQDYPVVQGIITMSAVIYVLLNTLSHNLYRILDPRVSR